MRPRGYRRLREIATSELQSGLPGGVGEGFDPTMIFEAAPVEHHRIDTFVAGPARQQLAHELTRRCLLLALGIVDDLRVDVLQASEHSQARTRLCPPQGLATARVALKTQHIAFRSLEHRYGPAFPPAPATPPTVRPALPGLSLMRSPT